MIGGWEWAIIIVVLILLFGSKRIPEIAKGLGQGIRSFKKELHADDAASKPSDADAKAGAAPPSKPDDSGPAAL